MTDSEVTELIKLTASLNTKMSSVQLDVTEIKRSQEHFVVRFDDLKTQVDILQTEHKDQMKQGGCNTTNESWQSKLLSPKVLLLLLFILAVGITPLTIYFLTCVG